MRAADARGAVTDAEQEGIVAGDGERYLGGGGDIQRSAEDRCEVVERSYAGLVAVRLRDERARGIAVAVCHDIGEGAGLVVRRGVEVDAGEDLSERGRLRRNDVEGASAVAGEELGCYGR